MQHTHIYMSMYLHPRISVRTAATLPHRGVCGRRTVAEAVVIHSEVDLAVMSLDMASQVCPGKVVDGAATH
jgi:hypothetical protein